MDQVPPILVAEDEPLVRLTMVEALRAGGYPVTEAEDGASALAVIEQSEEIRGLVTDVRLGSGPDGWEVARRGREKFPALAVVYVTADSITDWPANGVPQSLVLQKPFADAELLTAMASLLVAQQSNPPPA